MFECSDGQVEIDESVVLSEQLRVADFNSSLGLRRDGKHAGLEQPLSHVFEQCRILSASNNRFVDSACVGLLQQSTGQFFAIDDQCQPIDGGVLGDGEQQSGFECAVASVLEGLCDLDLGDLVVECRVDVNGEDAVVGGEGQGSCCCPRPTFDRGSFDHDDLGRGGLGQGVQSQAGQDEC